MKIVVLGATATTGAPVVDEALAAGHEVVALVRRPEAVAARDGLTVTCGLVEDVAAMRAAFAGADAVISCLGARMTPRIMFQGTDFQRRTLPLILSALEQANVKRFVLGNTEEGSADSFGGRCAVEQGRQGPGSASRTLRECRESPRQPRRKPGSGHAATARHHAGRLEVTRGRGASPSCRSSPRRSPARRPSRSWSTRADGSGGSGVCWRPRQDSNLRRTV